MKTRLYGLLILAATAATAAGAASGDVPSGPETVYATLRDEIVAVDFDASPPFATTVNTDEQTRKRFSSLVVLGAGDGVDIVASDAGTGHVLLYAGAAGAGAEITGPGEIRFPDGLSSDVKGNLYLVSRKEVYRIPAGGTRPGGYGDPETIDAAAPCKLTDTRVVTFTAGRLVRGDLLAACLTGDVLRYPADGDGFGNPEAFVEAPSHKHHRRHRGGKQAQVIGLAFSPAQELLVTTQKGVLRYSADGVRLADFYRERGLADVSVGIQAMEAWAFFADEGHSGSVRRVAFGSDGTAVEDAEVCKGVKKPSDVAIATAAAIPTPTGTLVEVVLADEMEVTYDEVSESGLTGVRFVELLDDRVHDVDQPLHDFLPEGSPLRDELPNAIVPGYMRGLHRGEERVILLAIVDVTAGWGPTAEVHFEEELRGIMGGPPGSGLEPCAADEPQERQEWEPRTWFAPEPAKGDLPIVEQALFDDQVVFTDVSTDCGSNVSRSWDFSLFATARDIRTLEEIVAFKLDNLEEVLYELSELIDPDLWPALVGALTDAEEAFSEFQETCDEADREEALASLETFVGLVVENRDAFDDSTRNLSGELIARGRSFQYFIPKVSCELPAEPLEIVTEELPKAFKHEPYSVQLEATGGTPEYTWSLVYGHLPKGLELSPDGVISGTPKEKGYFHFVVKVEDSAGEKDYRYFVLKVRYY